MTEQQRPDTVVNRSFIGGVVSTIVAGLLILAGARVAQWLARQPQPEAFIQAMTTPVLSIWGMVQIVFWLFLVYAVVYMAAFGPRP